jgi:hypothetical protein
LQNRICEELLYPFSSLPVQVAFEEEKQRTLISPNVTGGDGPAKISAKRVLNSEAIR